MNLDMMGQACLSLMRPDILLYLVAGVALGFIIGAIPGFNDTNVLAMLLPFSIYFGPLNAVVFMMAVFGGSQAAGPIPAILMNMPGTPSAAACCMDGYALTRKGMAKKALGVALMGAFVGGILGALVCIILGPIIGKYALTFGPSEMFMVSVFGLSAVSTLTGKHPLKGILSAVFGLLVAAVGTEAVAGYQRGTFGFFELYDGFPLIPVLLGLFGFSELFDMVNEKSIVQDAAQAGAAEPCTLWDGYRECLRHKMTLLRSSIIGVIIGIIPGTGAAIGSWIGYGQAKQWSKHPEEFGNGSYEGLAAVSSCNNGVTGGAIIPTITLGIPGSGTTLVIMTALMINNIQPGPSMFTEHTLDVYIIFLSLIISNLLILGLGHMTFNLFSKTTSVPIANLVPVIALCSLTGSFAARGMFFDFGLTVLFGLFGWLLKKYKYSPSAFLLSLILGTLAENNFIWGIKLEGWGMFTRPICLVLLVVTLLTLLVPVILNARKKN